MHKIQGDVSIILALFRFFFFSFSCGVYSFRSLPQLQWIYRKSSCRLQNSHKMLWFPLVSLCPADERGPHSKVSWPTAITEQKQHISVTSSPVGTIYSPIECRKCHCSHIANTMLFLLVLSYLSFSSVPHLLLIFLSFLISSFSHGFYTQYWRALCDL